MQWFPTATDRDYDQQHLVNEALRHDIRAHQDSLVGFRESTPLGEQVPPSLGFGPAVDNLIGMKTTIQQLRHDKLMEDVGEVKRIWRGRPKVDKPVEDDGDDIKY